MPMQFLKDIQDLKGKRVLVRVDFNVPYEKQKIVDDYKIRAALPTITLLMRRKARVILMSHWDDKRSLKPVAQRLASLLERPLRFVTACTGPKVMKELALLNEGEVLLLENLRKFPGEEENDKDFARALSELGDLYINEAFGVSHRAHASLVTVPKLLPSYAGLLFEKELLVLSHVIKSPQRPLVVLIGGVKISTKIEVMQHFLALADHVLVGGALANTFLKAQGYEVGDSLVEDEMVPAAKKFLQDKKLMLPVDVVVTKKSKIKNQKSKIRGKIQNVTVRKSQDVKSDEIIMDIGPETIRAYAEYIRHAQTIVWNGPMGCFEIPAFSHGSIALARFIASRSKGKAYGVVGGGETIVCLQKTGMAEYVDHISTGGGAMLAFLAGEKLPGVEALN